MIYWSFIEKTSVKQELKCKVCSKFQITFLHSLRWTPIGEALGQVDIFVRSLGQTDLWSDVPPIGEASGQIVIFVRCLGQADLWSEVPPERYLVSEYGMKLQRIMGTILFLI